MNSRIDVRAAGFACYSYGEPTVIHRVFAYDGGRSSSTSRYSIALDHSTRATSAVLRS